MVRVFEYELLSFCKSIKGRIFIFGAGDCAGRLIPFLSDRGIVVSAIVVSCLTDEKERLYNIPIKCISDFSAVSNDGVIIALANDNPDINRIDEALVERGVDPARIYLQRLFFRSLCRIDTAVKKGYFSDYTHLNAIGEKYGTDKNSKYHNYLNKYEFFLEKFRDKSITVLELGVFHAASLRTWKEYFALGQIVGVDIDERCKQYIEERIDVLIGDLGETEFVDCLTKLQPTVIVDDASHKWSHQINAICTLLPSLCDGGIYILEDINTSFIEDEGHNDALISAYEFCSSVSECVTGNTPLWKSNHRYEISLYSQEIEKIAAQVEMISFLHGSCLLIKK